MKRSILILLILVTVVSIGYAQKHISETYDVTKAKKLDLYFDYPQIVRVKVWDKNEVQVEGEVQINHGEFNDDFELTSSTSESTFYLKSKIKNIDSYKNYNVRTFTDEEDGEKRTVTVSNNGTTINVGDKGNRTYNGIEMDIELTVTVPRNMLVKVESRYGLVEVLGTPSEMDVEAKYGGIDITVNPSDDLNLEASTQWGQLFSNLDMDLKFNDDEGLGKWIRAKTQRTSAKQKLIAESQYGNVYLRKSK